MSTGADEEMTGHHQNTAGNAMFPIASKDIHHREIPVAIKYKSLGATRWNSLIFHGKPEAYRFVIDHS